MPLMIDTEIIDNLRASLSSMNETEKGAIQKDMEKIHERYVKKLTSILARPPEEDGRWAMFEVAKEVMNWKEYDQRALSYFLVKVVFPMILNYIEFMTKENSTTK